MKCSNSLYNLPIFCVPKKQGQGLRVVQDFRELNNHSHIHKYLMKENTECISQLFKTQKSKNNNHLNKRLLLKTKISSISFITHLPYVHKLFCSYFIRETLFCYHFYNLPFCIKYIPLYKNWLKSEKSKPFK